VAGVGGGWVDEDEQMVMTTKAIKKGRKSLNLQT
jgi:hypothetical protein